MTTKEIKIKVPTGYEFEKIVFKKKDELEHFEFNGAWIDEDSDIHTGALYSAHGIDSNYAKNIWISEAHAKASLAMSQLSVLMASPTYNGNWVADWEDNNRKYTINFYKNLIFKTSAMWISSFLSFKTEDARDRFLENHRGLIIEAKILL